MRNPLARLCLLSFFILDPSPGHSFPFSGGPFDGSFDTTLSYGATWRVQDRDPRVIGIANGGTASTVNGDDGDLNYHRGLVSHAVKVTHDFGLAYRNYKSFIRVNYFYDFYNINKSELSSDQKRDAGRDIDLLDAYLEGTFHPQTMSLTVRVGNQVLNWGESTFIQNGINIINPVDVKKLRIPGSELREALDPSPMAWASFAPIQQMSLEGFYLADFERLRLDTCGGYFSTSDLACEYGDRVAWGGYGRVPEGTAAAAVRQTDDHLPKNSGQYGLALRHFSSRFNQAEIGLYYVNYHSRLPIAGALRTTGNPKFYFEYPENIHLWGAGFSTELGRSGIAFQGEYSHRTNLPLQIENFEVLASAQGAPFSQLGAAPVGAEVKGYRRFNVGQWQGSFSKSFGEHNPFHANDWSGILELGATKVYGFPNQKDLRFEAPATELPARAGIPGAPGFQTTGWAESFSWGYVLTTQATYNRAIGDINLTPSVAFSHDVNGISPGPSSNFIQGRKALTIGLRGDYMNRWGVETNYTRYLGAGSANLLRDRDFVSVNIKYSI